MRVRNLLIAASLVVAGLGPAAPAQASACEPGDPNCSTGCDLINNTPVINKIASCDT